MGLTYDILRSELKYSLEDELEIVLLSLIEKGILIEFPFYRRLYQLTHTGHQALSSIDDTM